MALQEQLLEFYMLHRRVRGMEKRLKAAQRRQAALEGKFKQLSVKQAELAGQVKHARASVALMEQEAASIEAKTDDLRKQMGEVRTNKEYSALLVEVNTLKSAKSKIEDQTLEKMAEVDAMEAQLAELQASVEAQTKLVAGAVAEVAEQEAAVGEELAGLKVERDAASANVPVDIRSTWNRLDASHDGEVMAEVVEDDRKRMEYSCGGCYMRIPMELVNALLLKSADVKTCPSCGRILYISGELRGELQDNK